MAEMMAARKPYEGPWEAPYLEEEGGEEKPVDAENPAPGAAPAALWDETNGEATEGLALLPFWLPPEPGPAPALARVERLAKGFDWAALKLPEEGTRSAPYGTVASCADELRVGCALGESPEPLSGATSRAPQKEQTWGRFEVAAVPVLETGEATAALMIKILRFE